MRSTATERSIDVPHQRHAGEAGKMPSGLRIGQPFNPYKLFTGLFVPECLAKYRGLSCGAKLAYGRRARFAGEDGECWPAIETIGCELGIGKTQARKYIHELRDKRFIAIEQRSGTSDVFKFLWHEAFGGEVGKKRKHPPLRKTGGPPLRKTGGVPLRKTEGPPLRKTGAEESQWKENHPQESQIKRDQVLSALEAKGQTSSENHSSDDDQLQGLTEYASPWDEIRTAYRKANQNVDISAQDERWVKEQCEIRRVSFEMLVELLRRNPLAGFKDPTAGLKWLVKNATAKTLSTTEAEESASGFLVMMPPKQLPRCARCSNTGWVLEPREGERPAVTEQLCDCPMGKELEAVERRKPSAAIATANTGSTAREKYYDQIA